ncbi:MAG: hypothetical protein F2718_01530 [Actinobacteria bacterium]|uniref:Unannotated protein n=1 Tax=freshwater metagenome TaxID=449393 RepID=A0A6J6PC35_9ZZZZ|nr:hypothetical protein [Actinomycetota bacterium]MSY26794.1 hypothetical protein [Actinomycetota bacterium]MSZ86330.1 hypothetical protein [Actinomycetota bacterium]MTB14739.1 hypothetical protein [Actinomycetota bacterium]MTB24593.1 hypothetical protein [Actinomycetota bacterium]
MRNGSFQRSLSAVAALVLLSLTASIAAAYSGTAPTDLAPNQFGAVIQEGQALPTVSYVLAHFDAKDGDKGAYKNCATFSATDAHCLNADTLSANLMIPVCATATDFFCIQNIDFLRSDGSKEAASLLFEATTQKIPASPSLKTDAGGGMSIWSAPKFPHSGGNGTYLVSASVTYTLTKGNPSISVDSFNVVVTPMDMTTDAGARQNRPCEWADSSLGGNTNVSREGWYCSDNMPASSSIKNCSQMLDGLCFAKKEFSPGTKLSVALRVDNRVTGWLFGRMSETQVTVSPLDEKSNLLSVQGAAQSVPTLVGFVKKKELDKYPIINSRFQAQCPGWGYTSCAQQREGFYSEVFIGSGRDRFGDFNMFESQIQAYSGIDPDFKQDTNWSFGSTSYNGTTSGNGSCFADRTKLLGLVTTNAPVYESGPPKMTDGALTYRVAGAHLKADGTLFKGTYDLAIRSDVARCIYGFSSAPLQATISVTSTDGTTSEVATEAVSERDGWMRLSAANFTFSSPTIRIKLSQSAPIAATTPAPAAAAPVAVTSVATKVSAKKAITSTITCVKGSSSKKVTAVSPKCPVGYKKK